MEKHLSDDEILDSAVTAKVERQIKEKLSALAKADGRTLSNYVRRIFVAYLQNLENQADAQEKQPKAASPASLKSNPIAPRVIAPVKIHVRRS